jgi:membrane protease YdiL (CAAX protease family)
MKSYKRIFLFFLAVLLVNCLISPWMAAIWNLVLEANPEWHLDPPPFSRIFSRLYMILGIILFILYRKSLRIESPSQLGLSRGPRQLRDIGQGFGLAVLSLFAIVVTLTLADKFEPGLRSSVASGFGRAAGALMAGLAVGFFEEIFFRGMIFKGLMEDTKPTVAYCAANLFYAAIHFVRPAEKAPLSGLDPLAGFKVLAASFSPFLDPAEILPGLIGLFLIGAALSYAFLRTGSLYLSIGLHAGWIFSLKTLGIFGRYPRKELGWVFGASHPRIVSGVVTWIGILIVLVVIHWITRHRQPNRVNSPQVS